MRAGAGSVPSKCRDARRRGRLIGGCLPAVNLERWLSSRPAVETAFPSRGANRGDPAYIGDLSRETPNIPTAPDPTMKRLLPFGALLALLLIAWSSGLTRELCWDNLVARREQLGALVAAHRLAAPVLFVGIYAGVVALSLPGAAAIMTMTGGLLFGTWLGAACACIGATLGAITAFSAARLALAGPLAARAGPLLSRFRAGLEKDGFLYVLTLRLMPVFPFWLVNLAPALLGMRLAPFAAATAIGIVPGSLVFASIGAGLDDVLAAGGAPKPGFALLLPLAGLGVLSLAPIVWRKWKAGHGSLG